MNVKIVKKIYVIIYRLLVSEEKIFENNLKANEKIINFTKLKDTYEVSLENGQKLVVRNSKHSDYEVFKQIFNFEEYKIVSSILNNNPKFTNDRNDKIFIDAGANVGYTTAYFSIFYNFDKIFSIEPSVENISILSQNIKRLHTSGNIILLPNALSHKENSTFSINKNFRDQKDWAISTQEELNGTIEGITINQLIKEHNLKTITFLKIDIEGAERFIFKEENDLSFLKIVKIISIEIHNEYNIREEICELLLKNDFILFECGETTVGINKKFV